MMQYEQPHRMQTEDISEYRSSPREQERVASLMGLLPVTGTRVLDIGARDGYMSKLLADRYSEVIALDLETPSIDHPGVTPVRGNVMDLEFRTGYFDAVICAEVLEHIPPDGLEAACAEIVRVCRGTIVVGVPYRQDLRLGRTVCSACGQKNPPWGHVNSFDECRLRSLFLPAVMETVVTVGETRSFTNPISVALLDFAGNPYGTYEQHESCVHCGGSIGQPQQRSLVQKLSTRLAICLQAVQSRLSAPRGNWIHARFLHDL